VLRPPLLKMYHVGSVLRLPRMERKGRRAVAIVAWCVCVCALVVGTNTTVCNGPKRAARLFRVLYFHAVCAFCVSVSFSYDRKCFSMQYSVMYVDKGNGVTATCCHYVSNHTEWMWRVPTAMSYCICRRVSSSAISSILVTKVRRTNSTVTRTADSTMAKLFIALHPNPKL